MNASTEDTSADPEAALDAIYSGVDSLLRSGSFSVVDALLDALDVKKLPVIDVLAFASITRAATEHLPARTRFLARARQHLTEVDPARVDNLLAGFE